MIRPQMRAIVAEVKTTHTPESLAEQLQSEPGLVLLRSAVLDSRQARYSLLTARPFLTFRSAGSRCALRSEAGAHSQFGNPWRLLDQLMARYELLEEIDRPFPLGGCFGVWGYDLKNFVEPKLPRSSVNDLELPDCHVGFHDCVVLFDHQLDKTWVVSTGVRADGSRDPDRARRQLDWWSRLLAGNPHPAPASETLPARPNPALESVLKTVGRGVPAEPQVENLRERSPQPETSSYRGITFQTGSDFRSNIPSLYRASAGEGARSADDGTQVVSNLSRAEFIASVDRAQRYIRAGDIYQVNLSQRLAAQTRCDPWKFYERLAQVSPAPFSAYLDCGDFQLASSSPEMFLRLSGPHIRTRPIKGTRPRAADPTRDAQLTYELQTSAKEMAELVMITDLLRNDLGRVCEYGSVQVPELVRLERYAQVQHLVSTVEGRLRADVTHFGALAQCFPGGSVTGAPKIRAMEIIDELEPVTRGPYTGCLGYLGFNRESQLSIVIRTAVCKAGWIYFHAGAGIVADSHPEAEYEETLAKAGGFLAALRHGSEPSGTSRRPEASSEPRHRAGLV